MGRVLCFLCCRAVSVRLSMLCLCVSPPHVLTQKSASRIFLTLKSIKLLKNYSGQRDRYSREREWYGHLIKAITGQWRGRGTRTYTHTKQFVYRLTFVNTILSGRYTRTRHFGWFFARMPFLFIWLSIYLVSSTDMIQNILNFPSRTHKHSQTDREREIIMRIKASTVVLGPNHIGA